MKRKFCIFLIVLSGIIAYFGASFLIAGLALIKYEDFGGRFTVGGLIALVLGVAGIFGSIAAKRKVNRSMTFTKEDAAFSEALKSIDPDTLAKLKRERAQDMLTEDEFKQQVILKAQKHY